MFSLCGTFQMLVISLKLIPVLHMTIDLKVHFLFKLVMMTDDTVIGLNKWTWTNKMPLLCDS